MLLKRFRINIFSKIFLFSIGIVTVTLLISLLFNILFLDNHYIKRQKSAMLTSVKKIEEFDRDKKNDEIDNLILQIKESNGIEVKITESYNYSKMMMLDNSKMMMHHNPYKINITPEDNEKFKILKIKEFGSTILFYSKKLDNNRVLTLTTSLSVMSAHAHEMYIFNFLTGVAALIFSAGIGIIFSRKITGDLAKLNTQAEKIASLDFTGDTHINRDDELGDLGRSIEKMSKNLSRSIENMKSFVSNASHELKTPISILCTHAHALVRNQVPENDKKLYYDILLKEGLEMKELSQNLLTLSKIDSPEFTPKKESINLKEVFAEYLEKYDFLEFEKDITVNLNIVDIFIIGDPYLVKLAINNIINNALKYSPENSSVDIYRDNNKIFVSNSLKNNIEDSIEDLWQPFTRGVNAQEESTEGSGLGLSIIKKTLDLNHINSSISIEDNKFLFCLELKGDVDEN